MMAKSKVGGEVNNFPLSCDPNFISNTTSTAIGYQIYNRTGATSPYYLNSMVDLANADGFDSFLVMPMKSQQYREEMIKHSSPPPKRIPSAYRGRPSFGTLPVAGSDK